MARNRCTAIEGRPERRIAIQEYGRPSDELDRRLAARGAEVTSPRLRLRLARGSRTSSRRRYLSLRMHRSHTVHDIPAGCPSHADRPRDGSGGRGAFRAFARASSLPSAPRPPRRSPNTVSTPDLEPSHPKLGILVKEAAEQAESSYGKRRAEDRTDGKKSIWVIAGEYSAARVHFAELRSSRDT